MAQFALHAFGEPVHLQYLLIAQDLAGSDDLAALVVAHGSFARAEGVQRAPMGQAVIGGVITSSLLTLVVVPVTYCYLDDLGQWFKRRFGRGETTHD